MGAPRKYTVAQIEKELHETHGAITLAAENLGAAYNTVRRYVNRSPTLQKLIEHYKERKVDRAELKLEQAIEDGQPWAISLVLKTLGKDRGYVGRLEQQVSGNVTIGYSGNVDPDDL